MIDQISIQDDYPAPWIVSSYGEPAAQWSVIDANGSVVMTHLDEVVARKIALWRNAEDVMMRRHWHPMYEPNAKQWFVSNVQVIKITVDLQKKDYPRRFFPDPATALVKMDQWYKEHVKPKEVVSEETT